MQRVFDMIFPWFWALVWFTLPLSIRANSVSLIAFGLVALGNALYHKPRFNRHQLILASLFLLLFAWLVLGPLIADGSLPAWKLTERKLSLVAIPLLLLLVSGTRDDLSKWAIRGLFAGLVLSGVHMLAVAGLKMIQGQPAEAFTYHAFTGRYALGAIYYSFYLSAALYYLAFRQTEPFIARYRLFLGIFFLALLLFSASKLFIVLSLPAIIFPFLKIIRQMSGIKKYLLPVLLLIVLLFGSIPFLNRVSELKNTDLNVVTQDRFRYDTPLNGLTFRMLLWRLAGEIMADENAWLTGTGIDNSQETLDHYYARYGIYTGNPDLGDTGYLGYNFHNQFLETMVGSGIPGLLLLLAIIPGVFLFTKKAFFFPVLFYIVTFIFFMTESVLERQAGLVFFCLLWNFNEDNSFQD